jgi:uncharacterized membrane protein
MEENETRDLAEMERQTARKWYRWLWLSPFITIPTLALVLITVNPYIEMLVCPQGWHNCNYDAAYRLNGLIAVVFSALWHLLLLIPSLNVKSQFVRWHGKQAMILAGVRTAVPLAFIVIFRYGISTYLAILILIPIWFFGTLWGQRQAARGDCSLMRWTGREEALPGPPAEPELAQDFSPETLVNIIRFSKDPERRRSALDQLEKHGMVENL